MVSAEDTVMLVEDDVQARSLLREILEMEGFKVVAFSNGYEALNYLRDEEAPCLVVLDLRMPVMDGTQLRSAMLKDPRLARIPVIVVTAFDGRAAAGLSVLKVLKKPVDVDALLSLVKEYC